MRKLKRPANPGPSWGYAFLSFTGKYLPDKLFYFLLGIGTAVGLVLMPKQRGYSREYLNLIFKRPSTRIEQWRHFFALTKSLIKKLRVGDGCQTDFTYHPEFPTGDFQTLMTSATPAILGTFHMGHCDLLGCMLSNFSQKVAMVRLKMDNSKDTEFLEKQFGNSIHFLWINEPEEFLFALKNALETEFTLALQCDRPEFSQRSEVFDFLNSKRLFPITIYQLAYLFKRPVAFAFACDAKDKDKIQVIPSAVFHPLSDRKENEKAGIEHFKSVLKIVETILKEHPYIWFNFLPFEGRSHVE
jgi:predicted LPLAT superfamily acyltransferase